MAFLFIGVSSCQKDEPLEEELPEAMDDTNDDSKEDDENSDEVNMDDGEMEKSGSFMDRDHPTSGTARLVNIDGKYFLELADFKTDNGPALKTYLSKEEDPKSFVDLGDLKSTSGTFNYEIPSNVDPNEFPLVLIWCEKFSVLFGAAELN